MTADRWLIDWQPGEPDWLPYYTRANAGETLPDPSSPLNWTLVWEQGFVPGWVRGMETMGIYHEGQFPREQPAQLGMFAGYFYINLSHIRLMLMVSASPPRPSTSPSSAAVPMSRPTGRTRATRIRS